MTNEIYDGEYQEPPKMREFIFGVIGWIGYMLLHFKWFRNWLYKADGAELE